MVLSETNARHTFLHVRRPPIVVPGNIQVARIFAAVAVRAAYEVGELVTILIGRIRAPGVVKYGPRNRRIVGSVGDVEVTIRAIVNVAVIDPDVGRLMSNADRIGATGTVRWTIGAIVALDRDVSENYIRYGTQL